MSDETRKLLKVFGMAVTDAEVEAEKLAALAAGLSTSSNKDEIAKLLKDASDLCRELDTRWLEITQRVKAIQNQLLSRLSDAAARAVAAESTAS
jgi:hypothetical protein